MPGVGEVPKVAPSSLSNSWEGTGLVGGGMKAGHRPWPAGPAQTVLLAALVSQRAAGSSTKINRKCPHGQHSGVVGQRQDMCGSPRDKCGLKQQTQTMLTKRASAHRPQCQLPLASDPSQRWHVGSKARKSQQGCGAWGLQHSRKTPMRYRGRGRAPTARQEVQR